MKGIFIYLLFTQRRIEIYWLWKMWNIICNEIRREWRENDMSTWIYAHILISNRCIFVAFAIFPHLPYWDLNVTMNCRFFSFHFIRGWYIDLAVRICWLKIIDDNVTLAGICTNFNCRRCILSNEMRYFVQYWRFLRYDSNFMNEQK